MNDAKCQNTENKKKELKRIAQKRNRFHRGLEDIELIRVCGMLML